MTFILLSLDINECEQGAKCKLKKNSECVNTVGSYECACVSGYSGDGNLCEGKKYKNEHRLGVQRGLQSNLWFKKTDQCEAGARFWKHDYDQIELNSTKSCKKIIKTWRNSRKKKPIG